MIVRCCRGYVGGGFGGVLRRLARLAFDRLYRLVEKREVTIGLDRLRFLVEKREIAVVFWLF